GQVLPGPAHALDLSLPAEAALGAHFACDPGHFAGERVELVDHHVDGVLQLEDFAFHVDRDLLGQVAACHGGGDLGDVADLAGEVARHGVDVVGEVLPSAADALDLRLAAQPAFGADLTRHPRHL